MLLGRKLVCRVRTVVLSRVLDVTGEVPRLELDRKQMSHPPINRKLNLIVVNS